MPDHGTDPSADHPDDASFSRLHPDQGNAVDRVFAAWANGEEPIDQADAPVAALLALLQTDGSRSHAESERLVRATASAAIKDAMQRVGTDQHHAETLSALDEDAVEALVDAGFMSEGLPGRVRDRAERVERLLGALETGGPAAGSDARVRGVMAAIESREPLNSGMLAFAETEQLGVSRRGFGWRDIASVAALLLVGVGVIAPVFTAVREMSQRSHCEANLARAGIAFGLYAGDFRQSLPMASASAPGETWWDVGDEDPSHSNSANLFTMVRSGYAKIGELACPGNPSAVTDDFSPQARDWGAVEEVSYSYQNLFAADRPAWSRGPSVVVLADRSPVILRAKRGGLILPFENSPNHDGRGQNALRNDGAVIWLRTPALPRAEGGGDNIWLPRGIEQAISQFVGEDGSARELLTGSESPESAEDVFLGP